MYCNVNYVPIIELTDLPPFKELSKVEVNKNVKVLTPYNIPIALYNYKASICDGFDGRTRAIAVGSTQWSTVMD